MAYGLSKGHVTSLMVIKKLLTYLLNTTSYRLSIVTFALVRTV